MKRAILGILVGLCVGSAHGQAWMSSYMAGIREGRVGHWAAARQDFQQAIANRPDDVARPTLLPGSPTEPRKWRNGAPYSPNFLAAYSQYRVAVDTTDTVEETHLLQQAANEFETLLAKGQQSRDAYFFLDMIYTRLADQTKRQDLEARSSKNASQATWKVDEEIVAPEELAAMGVGSGSGGTAPTVEAASIGTTGQILNPIVPGLAIGAVPAVPGKFALVLAETDAHTPGGHIAFAGHDAQTVRDALVNYAGYAPANVVGIVDGSSSQIMDAARKMASTVAQDGVVTIYFVGTGVNADGKDFLVTSDAANASDVGHMVSKADLYNLFLVKGGRVFAFYEASRPMANGASFGSELQETGSVSQMQATIQNSGITSVYYNGSEVGLYALSFADVLAELRSNRIPIYEFGWQLFNKMRRGNTGTTGGGASRQIPTLPVLNNLASDARF